MTPIISIYSLPFLSNLLMLVVVTDSQFRVASDPDGSIGSCGTTIWTHSSCKRLCVWIFSLHAKDSFIQNYNHLMYIEKDLETSIRTWFYSLSLSLSRTILFLWQTRSDTQFVSSTFRIFKSLSNKTKSSVPFSILKKLVPILISSSFFLFKHLKFWIPWKLFLVGWKI